MMSYPATISITNPTLAQLENFVFFATGDMEADPSGHVVCEFNTETRSFSLIVSVADHPWARGEGEGDSSLVKRTRNENPAWDILANVLKVRPNDDP